MELTKGLIMRSTGSWYEIRSESGKVFAGRLKGKFRFAIFREGSTEKSKLSQYKIAHLQKMQNKSEVKGKN